MKILFCKFNIDTACVEVWGGGADEKLDKAEAARRKEVYCSHTKRKSAPCNYMRKPIL